MPEMQGEITADKRRFRNNGYRNANNSSLKTKTVFPVKRVAMLGFYYLNKNSEIFQITLPEQKWGKLVSIFGNIRQGPRHILVVFHNATGSQMSG